MRTGAYRQSLIDRFWDFRRQCFDQTAGLFDQEYDRARLRPPVFNVGFASMNVLANPSANEDVARAVALEIPARSRHKWFRSMSSSQALAQSVFANLKVLGKLDVLAGLKGQDGTRLFADSTLAAQSWKLEYDVTYLGEPRPTSVDVFLEGPHPIAIECKLSEAEVGTCSRPRLTPRDGDYEQGYCDGRFIQQRGRTDRCSLSAIGVQYWRYIPDLFYWPADVDHDPCPLWLTYQLVRNVLAVAVGADRDLRATPGHVLLLYDVRNPAFQEGGVGHRAWHDVKVALKNPALLQMCTWQDIIVCLRQDQSLDWLVQAMNGKYGFSERDEI